MKQIVCVISAVIIFTSTFAVAGQGTLALPLSTDKTTTLVFPYSVLHVDRGTRDILVQPVKEAGNIILAKAGQKNFSNTNLTVITADGAVYCFDAHYSSMPPWTIFHLDTGSVTNGKIPYTKEPMNIRDLETYSKGILDNEAFMHGIKDKSGDVTAGIRGIYIKDHVLFFQFAIENRSAIDYDINFIRLFIRDKKQVKRTPSQELDIIPLYSTGNKSTVLGYGTNTIVFALEKFTIPDAKNLFIQVGEKNGGRHLLLKVRNSKLLKAKELPSYF